jgi:glycosyltransferase involved in cell wall biosynthesis
MRYTFNVGQINIIQRPSYKSWVLGQLAQELQKRLKNFRIKIVNVPLNRREIRSWNGTIKLPKSDVNLFLHHDLALVAIKKFWLSSNNSKNIIYFTHLNGSERELVDFQDCFKLLLVNNSQTRTSIEHLGIIHPKILVHPNPTDEIFFCPYPNDPKRDVVFVGDYVARKRPDLILKTVQANPKLTFTLLGRNWRSSLELKALKGCSNFNFQDFQFSKYPENLREHKVFCTLSDIEGGPVPLLESLISGLAVVATDTGTARDLIPIADKSNIIPIDPDTNQITQAIHDALSRTPAPFFIKDEYFYEGFAKMVEREILFFS